jgi:CHAT domain-containing protein/cytochrome c-type biogenesis protein CcmH/NrfG
VLEAGDQHLTDEELDQLAGIPEPWDLDAGGSLPSDTAAFKHFSNCQNCRRKLEERIAASKKLAFLKTAGSEDRGDLCPSDEEWMNVVAGIEHKEVSEKMLDHAAHCDHCGPVVHRLTREFSESASPEETRIVENLASSSPDWQRSMAARLSVSTGYRSHDTRRSLPSWAWKLLTFGSIAVVLTAVVIWVVFPWPQRRVERLLADSYTQHRNLEPRIPGAQFAPLKVERAQQTSHMDSPASLLEAEKEITSHLASSPSDPFWLQSRGRAELLEGNYQGAIDVLRLGLAAKPSAPSLLIDLATAYSQRGDATEHAEDYGTAVELLGQALKVHPRDPIALFNRAVISRKAFLFSQAIEDWKAYLEIDPTGEWADDARSRLKEAQDEQQKRKQLGIRPLLTPSQFAALDLDNPLMVEIVDDRFESYASVALSKWLAVAYPAAGSDSLEATDARTALRKLAKLSVDKHSDRWWSDLLMESSSPLFPRAVKQLASAVDANERGATETAHESAGLAIQYFRYSGNNAGILRSRLEDLYAFNIDQNADLCGRLVRSARLFREVPYRWLEIESLIQQGNCLWLQENLGAALPIYSSAANKAKESNYRVLFLRAKDHWSMAAGETGNYAAAWKVASEALREFWDGNFEDVRGYNFYYSLYEMARLRQEPYLQVSIWKDAIPLTEESPDLAQLGVAHSLYANSALATNDPLRAVYEFNQAMQLFARSPQVEATRLARFEAETRLAGVEIGYGQNQAGLSRLQSIEREVTGLSDKYLQVLFYGNFGKALLAQGDLAGGENALRSAVGLAQLQLHSAQDDKARLEWKQNVSEPYRNLVSLLFRKGEVTNALETWEAFKAAPAGLHDEAHHSPNHAEASATHGLPVAARFRDLSKATVISYAVLSRELIIWTYDDRGVNSYRSLISASEISSAAMNFRELCSNPESNPELIRKRGRSLYEQLIAPIESYLQPGRALIIELDEGLSDLPMEALLDRNNHYLGERVPIVSSLGILYAAGGSAGQQIGPGTTALVVGVSSPQETAYPVHPLPDVVAEAEEVAGHFRNAHLLTGHKANLQDTLRDISDSGVVHFAGHASISPTTSALLLSDAPLTTKSLETLKFSKTYLVVLSACDTDAEALGTANAGDSLVGYFVRAGVPRVVASRWNVDSASTRQFMKEFYEHLLAGASVEDSLFRAQNAMRTQSRSGHPFYWTAFTVFGSDIT